MVFRKTQEKDKDQVIGLWRQAQAYFKEQGIDQWQDGYPNEESLASDMASEESYVLTDVSDTEAVDAQEHVVATAFISFRGEPDYHVIYDGSWQENGPYGVVHRVAVENACKGRGLGGILIENAVRMCREREIYSLRMDTHEDNRSMQRMLVKNGFVYRGIIYLGRDGARRVAFEKSLEPSE